MLQFYCAIFVLPSSFFSFFTILPLTPMTTVTHCLVFAKKCFKTSFDWILLLKNCCQKDRLTREILKTKTIWSFVFGINFAWNRRLSISVSVSKCYLIFFPEKIIIVLNKSNSVLSMFCISVKSKFH